MTSNLAASVRARLTNHAKASKRPFEEVLQHYGLERLLYRVAELRHRRLGASFASQRRPCFLKTAGRLFAEL